MSNKPKQLKKMKGGKNRKQHRDLKNIERIKINSTFAEAYMASLATIRQLEAEHNKAQVAMNNLITGATLSISRSEQLERYELSKDQQHLVLHYASAFPEAPQPRKRRKHEEEE